MVQSPGQNMPKSCKVARLLTCKGYIWEGSFTASLMGLAPTIDVCHYSGCEAAGLTI